MVPDRTNRLGLDIGAGTFEYKDLFANIPIIAIDSFKENHNQVLEVANGEIEPFLNYLIQHNIKFNFIFSRWVLNYFPNRPHLIQKLKKVTELNGTLYFIEQYVAPIYDPENNYSSVSIKEMKDIANSLDMQLEITILSSVVECLTFQLNDLVDCTFQSTIVKSIVFTIVNSTSFIFNTLTFNKKSARLSHSILYSMKARE